MINLYHPCYQKP